MGVNIHAKNKLWFLLLFAVGVIVGVSSCKNSRLSRFKDRSAKFVGTVKVSAGDDIDYMLEDTLNFMAFPMNVALYKNKQGKEKIVYIIGKSVKKEQNIGFQPFAKLNYTDHEHGDLEVVLSIPGKKDLVTADINNYFEFISLHYGVQKIIEEWVKNAKGFGSTSKIEWQNEAKAIEYLQN